MSSTQSTARPRVLNPSIEDLLHEVRAGRLRLPSFGRPLRWGTRQVVDLFDSIYRGFPIGNLVLAQQPAEAASLRFGPVDIEAPARSDAWFIVDGQQRLTALVGALLHPEALPYGDLHAIWFDLDTETFHRLDGGSPPATWVPLNLCVHSVHLLEWLAEWPLRAERHDLVKRAMELSMALREYRVPMHVLDSADTDGLHTIFTRLNMAGVAMKKSEVVNALHGDRELRPLGAATTRLGEQGFGTFDPSLLVRIVRIVGADDRPADEVGGDPSLVAAAEQAIGRCIVFLRGDAGVPHMNLLPYRLPLFVLARFFHLHPSPGPRARLLLSRWIWRGALTGSHGRQPDAQVGAMCRDLDAAPSADAAASRLLAETPTDFEPIDLRARWNARHGASRLFALGLVGLGPRQLRDDSGATCNWTDGLSEFWDDLSAVVRSPLRESATPRAERMLLTCDGRPVGTKTCRSLPALVGPHSGPFWTSHAIDSTALDALQRNDHRGFAEARAAMLAPLLEDYFRSRAATGHSDRPSIAHLVGRLQDATTP